MALLNKKFYENLDAKIDTIPSEKEAEDYIKQVFEPIQKQLDTLSEKIVTPLQQTVNAYVGEANIILTLLDPPSDPMAIIPWVNGVVSSFTAKLETMKQQIKPYLDQYEAAQEMTSGLPSEVSTLETHLRYKIDEKGWKVDVPSIVYPTLPPLPPIPDVLK